MLKDLFINATILITFISLGNQLLKNSTLSPSSPLIIRIVFGGLAGTFGCILMLFSMSVSPNIIFDFRNFPIIIASIFGGFISSIIVSIIIGFFRVIFFGATYYSIAAFIIAIIMGLGCSIITSRISSFNKKWLSLTLFSVFLASMGFIILINDKSLLVSLLPIYLISNLIVSLILYSYINTLVVSNELYRKYKEESSKDFLTGLNNVRQFDKIFNNITNRLAEKEESLSLLFIDIDFFKKVNDIYGHAEGDIVLRELGKILIKTCRDFDIVSRNGGEEFSVMLLDCTPQQGLIIAERIHTTVELNNFTLTNGKVINITISIGIATYPDTTTDFHALIKEADKALYMAKHTGRNKVVLAEV